MTIMLFGAVGTLISFGIISFGTFSNLRILVVLDHVHLRLSLFLSLKKHVELLIIN